MSKHSGNLSSSLAESIHDQFIVNQTLKFSPLIQIFPHIIHKICNAVFHVNEPVFFTQNELRHDKTNQMACAPIEDSDQPGHLPSRCSNQENMGS